MKLKGKGTLSNIKIKNKRNKTIQIKFYNKINTKN